MRLVYLIGPPGVGKSTAVRAALGPPDRVATDPFAHSIHWDDRVIELGYPREPFGGTDTLPYSVQSKVLRWLEDGADENWLIVGEGDRLANHSFFDECPVPFSLIVCEGPWRSRSLARGTRQSASWVKGRVTKCEGLAASYAGIPFDLGRDLEIVAADLRGLLAAATVTTA